jgi:hypothetical protein
MIFDLELTGRRALVTAGTKGVGAAVVEVLPGLVSSISAHHSVISHAVRA